ncbi:glycosyltransferase [Bacteroides fragilis]
MHLWQKHRAISKSNFIICISENTKRDLLKFLPDINETKIRVIHNGVSDDYFPIKEREELELPLN